MNLLTTLVDQARLTVASGYYRSHGNLRHAPSLVAALREAKAMGRTAIVAELKPASPTRGRLLQGGVDALVGQYVADGATAISVLTEPHHFGGSVANLRKCVATRLPVLMKDFVVDEQQIDFAAEEGVSAVLLIASILGRKRMNDLVEYTQLCDREVVLEVSSEAQYAKALDTTADIIGINNRDLRTFEVDRGRTARIVASQPPERPVLSLSGFETAADLGPVRPYCDGFLVGSALIEGRTTVEELMA